MLGSVTRRLIELCHQWVGSVEINSRDCINLVMLDCIDEFYAAVFNGTHGYYRQAIGSMRSAVELICIGVYCNLYGLTSEFIDWREARSEIKFGRACDMLPKTSPVSALETHLNSHISDSLFSPSYVVAENLTL